MGRYLRNEKTGEYLLFPDCAFLHELGNELDGDRRIVSISIRLGSKKDAALPERQRAIILTDETLEIASPKDPDVLRFRFVKTAGLAGTLVLTIKADRWDYLKEKIVSAVGFLPLKYTGNSEIFWSFREIAKIHFTADDRMKVNAIDLLFRQLNFLKNILIERSDLSPEECDHWLQKIVDDDFSIEKSPDSFRLNTKTGSVALKYRKFLEAVEVVQSNDYAIQYEWEAA